MYVFTQETSQNYYLWYSMTYHMWHINIRLKPCNIPLKTAWNYRLILFPFETEHSSIIFTYFLFLYIFCLYVCLWLEKNIIYYYNLLLLLIFRFELTPKPKYITLACNMMSNVRFGSMKQNHFWIKSQWRKHIFI